MSLRLEVRERGGDQVLSAEKVRLTLDDRVLLDQFTARVMRGDRVGILGPNGAGKSTLLRAIIGERPVDGGVLRLGASTTVAYYRQDLSQVPLDRTLYEIINDLRPLWTRGQIQGHLGRFGFSGDEVLRRAESLSGGERARVALAMMMLSGANLLILDEPTNHLDVESIEAIEDAVERYPGTVMLVSHDRALLRAIASRVWVLHESRMTVFDGSFAEWEVVSEERAHAARVAAEEEEALRRVREHKKVERPASAKGPDLLRSAQRSAEAAEARVAAAEAEVNRLTAALGDPELYATPSGVARSSRLGSELDAARRALDAALEEWTLATETVERLSS